MYNALYIRALSVFQQTLSNGGFLVTFYKDIYTQEYIKRMNLNDRQIKAVFYLKKSDFITNSIYQEICKTSERTASRDLEQLSEKNILKKIGEKKGQNTN